MYVCMCEPERRGREFMDGQIDGWRSKYNVFERRGHHGRPAGE